MQAISNTGMPLPVGKTVSVFTNSPALVGEEFNVVDRNRQVLNVARVTQIQLSSEINVKLGKYVVQGEVVQDLSIEHDAPLTARVYWT